MGYHAYGGGHITLRPMNKDDFTKLARRLATTPSVADAVRYNRICEDSFADIRAMCDSYQRETYLAVVNYLEEVAGLRCEDFTMSDNNEAQIDAVYDYGYNYYGDEFWAALELIEPFMCDCNIEFNGEDDAHWKFTFRNGKLAELDGDIVYPDETDARSKELSAFDSMCIECDSTTCAYVSDWGKCIIPFLRGRAPKQHENGCDDYVLDTSRE